ncbi:MAG: hypothetical protein D0433_03345 [Candidatus Thermochlorobacter aerophilum]|uniref:Phytase-like domain-containing protein n=1 Tax=Candidatus Thermochlorobacter aerophilus TaxID=1868324 RepID=A0A395M2B2_9BACT|nr:MAG: hypothetical protein D0433_03345 [Candidatus Thermochlorobacter aerophilum]
MTKTFSQLIQVRSYLFFGFSFLVLLFFSCSPQKPVRYLSRSVPTLPLTLKAVLPIESTAGDLELSGLALHQNTLYGVCDDHGDMIFKLTLYSDKVLAEPFLRFDPPSLRPDFEGLACDSAGNFYIISESECRIFFVSHDGKVTKWLMPSLEEQGKAAGLFQRFNAYPEGLALISPTHFFIAAEHSPRGLIDLKLDPPPHTRFYVCDYTAIPLRGKRVPDFADLYYESGRLFALARNAEAVVELSIEQDSVFEKTCWSYQQAVAHDSLRYGEMRFGLAEGLTMDSTSIYIVYDTNGEVRNLSSGDRRPLLFIFDRPR